MKKLLLLLSLVYFGQINAQNPTANFTVNSGCIDSSICFHDLSVISTAPITSWAWGYGDGSTTCCTNANPCHYYAFPGTFTVTLIVIDSLGHSDTINKPVTVYPLPAISCYASPDTIIFGNVTVLHASANGVSSNNSYTWTPCCAMSSQWGSATTANPTVTTCYTVTATDTNGCRNSCHVCLHVTPCPTAAFTYGLSSCCNQGFFTDSSYISSGDSIVAWNWTFRNGYPSSSSNQNPGAVYLNFGMDTVCLTVTSSHGCKDSICKLVNETIMSVRELNNSSSISIYPNPTSDQFFIEANAADKLIIDLFDVNGRHVFRKNVNNKSNVDVTTLDVGVYSMTIKTSESIINKKLVILR
jgi:PKD repeat protein